MRRSLLNPLIVLGTAVLVAAVFWGGWQVLDRLFDPYFPYGTRTLYQEASRVVTMSQPTAYVGAERCAQCHFSAEQEWLHSAHKTVTCENCHGPRATHVETGAPVPVNTSADLCLTCHARLASRPDAFPQVNPEEHANGSSCVQCHNPMHPDTSSPPQVLHALSQGMDCLSCHGSQGFRPFPADHEQWPADSCPQCHLEGGGL